MTDENRIESGDTGEIAAEAEVRQRRRLSIVWVVPVVAAVVAAGLWIQTVRERGPAVTVSFDDGSSLEAGKTKVQFDGVEVGRVVSVALSKDLETVVTEIQLDASAERMAQDGAEYWVVRPNIGFGGISGLETLVSGSFIGVVPGNGAPKHKFVGVGQPPMSTVRIPGLQLMLFSKNVDSLQVGSPVAFRQIRVGEVTGYTLRKDRAGVDLTIVIYKRHQSLVRRRSSFWNTGGIRVALGPAGLTVDTQSVEALLLGGISFTTPLDGEGGGEVADGQVFKLHEDKAAVRRAERVRDGLNIVLESGALGSVQKGDPVSYREVQVGEVRKAALGEHSERVQLHVNIWPEYSALVRENSQFWNASGLRAHFGLFSGLDVSIESLASLIAGGVAFATPTEPGPQAANDAVFQIAAKPEDHWLTWTPRIDRLVGAVVHAPGTLVRKGAAELKSLGSGDDAKEPDEAGSERNEQEEGAQAPPPARHELPHAFRHGRP